MDLFTFILLSGAYLMVVYFAIGIRRSSLPGFLAVFIFSGVLARLLDNYLAGFALASVMTLFFW